MYSLDRIPRGLRLTFGFFYRNAMILCRLLDCRHAQGFTSSAPYSALSYDLQKLLVKVIQHSDAAFFSCKCMLKSPVRESRRDLLHPSYESGTSLPSRQRPPADSDITGYLFV